jgi:dTDP-glucose 4,6-dehydratase
LAGGLTKDVSNLEVAKILLSLFKKDNSDLRFIKDRPGHDRRYSVDWSKIKKDLGWKPKHDFEKWLVYTVNWYKENGWWETSKEKAEDLYKN